MPSLKKHFSYLWLEVSGFSCYFNLPHHQFPETWLWTSSIHFWWELFMMILSIENSYEIFQATSMKSLLGLHDLSYHHILHKHFLHLSIICSFYSHAICTWALHLSLSPHNPIISSISMNRLRFKVNQLSPCLLFNSPAFGSILRQFRRCQKHLWILSFDLSPIECGESQGW